MGPGKLGMEKSDLIIKQTKKNSYNDLMKAFLTMPKSSRLLRVLVECKIIVYVVLK